MLLEKLLHNAKNWMIKIKSKFHNSRVAITESLVITREELVLYQRMIDHPPTGLIKAGSFSKMMYKAQYYQHLISPNQFWRFLRVFIVRIIMSPLRIIDKMLQHKIMQTPIAKPPIFILGVYRSGTTHLHNLLCKNELLASLTNHQAANPESFISGRFMSGHLARIITPKERPLDSMQISPDSPQEHQFAMLNLMTPVFTDFFLFPSKYKELLKLGVISKLPPDLQQEWEQKFTFLVKKLTYFNCGKQLAFKNPHDTANLATLLKLFPNAKFVFIHRNPEKVLPSLINMLRAMMYGMQLEGRQFSKVGIAAVHYFKNVLTPIATDAAFIIYKELMMQYLEERARVPKGNLFELNYEDLVQNPIAVMKQLHDELAIITTSNYTRSLQTYLATLEQKVYKTNKFSPLPLAVKERMYQELDFVFESLGYNAIQEN